MTVQTLSQAGALTAGSELWILPGLEQSAWCHKIDWYLNFRLVKSSMHRPLKLSERFIEMSQDWEFPLETSSFEHKDQLLVASSRLLPNRYVVQIEFKESLDLWLKEYVEVWKSLKRPTSRLFLPDGIDLDELQIKLESISGPEHITVLKNDLQ